MSWLSFLCCVVISLQDPWDALWRDLEVLRAGTRSGAESALLRARLEEAARGDGESPRLLLLRVELDHLAGLDVRARAQALARVAPAPFSARELWFLVDPLPTSNERVEAVLVALAGTPELQGWQARLAWNVAIEEVYARRHAQARPIQEALHARLKEVWSALDLAETYRHLGLRRELEDLFAAALRATPSPALWQAYARATLGNGDERRGRDYLGRALALGSIEAVELLGRLELVQGRGLEARATFRTILQAPPSDWAWRGWGTTLLPRTFVPPATLSSTHPPE